MEVTEIYHGTQFPSAPKPRDLAPGAHVCIAFDEYSWFGTHRHGSRPHTLKRRFAVYVINVSPGGSVYRDLISRHATLEAARKAGARTIRDWHAATSL